MYLPFIYFKQIPLYWHGESGPSIICLHGAGHSGLSFAPLASYFNKYRIISFDFRGHGYNTMSEGEDLSNTSLISDTLKVIQYVNNKFPSDTMIIVGHSMGGSIATKACAEILKNEEAYPDIYMKIQGLIVIDVVEGTAKDALPFMESVVTSRPKSFRNTEGAIEFMYKSSTIRNLESARITVPPLVKEVNVGNKIIASWKTNLLASQKYWNGKLRLNFRVV